jgi:hypothetical protein
MRRPARAALAVLLGLCLCASGEAASLRFCDHQAALSATQQDRIFRFAALIKTELDGSERRAAIVSRSGLDLARFGQRYSHAGVSLQAGLDTPWAVRQLYYACEEGRPRIFDQGLLGFLLGMNDPALGYMSVILLPPLESSALERGALDKRQALQALAPAYSANAYAFGLAFQNCNQWLIELLAAAWAPLQGAPLEGVAQDFRAQAQRWLREQGYVPSAIDVGALMVLGAFIPWVHNSDHPREDLERALYRVSMPASIEAFVRAKLPGASRIEFCRAGTRVVIHRGWDAIAEGCQPGQDDTVVKLEIGE